MSKFNGIHTLVRKKTCFSDIEGHWAQQEIEEMASRMITNGCTVDSFIPDREMTRAEFLVMLTRAVSLPLDCTVTTFTDLNENAWYFRYLAALERSGILIGYPDGTCRPDEVITWEEAVLFVSDTMHLIGMEEDFAEDIQDTAVLFNQCKEETNPAAVLTRANGIVLIRQFLKTAGII